MPDCFYLSEPERRKLDARLKRSAQTVAFFWAPGIIGEESVNAESCSKCCGQKIRVEPGSTSLRTRIATPTDALTRGRHAGEQIGSNLPITPTCTVTDKQIDRLGANTSNKTTFSAHRFDTWTSVVYGTLPVPADMLRNLVRAGECHVYCDGLKQGDTLFTDGRTVAITSAKGGSYGLSFPGQFDAIDLFTGDVLGEGVSELVIQLSSGAPGLLELRPIS